MTRPNLLLFMTDQQRADSIGAFGAAVPVTPNIDALARRGVRFTNAFGQHSACSQSRISMMTGWYPHVAGHRTLDNLLQAWEPNLLRTLKDAGYFVAWAGVRGDTFAPGVTAASTDVFGFTVSPDLAAIRARHEARYPEGHRLRNSFHLGALGPGLELDQDEAAVRTAIDLLGRGLPEPFVLVLTLAAPHPPFVVGEPWYSLVDRADVPPPVVAGPGKPGFMAAFRRRAALDDLGADDWAEIRATYFGMVACVDDQFGRVQAALDDAGVGERTVTVFHTDHGEYLGDYGLVEKWPSGLDDCLLRNPLIIAGPGVVEGGVCSALVEMIDLPVTLAEFAEVELGHAHFGRSLSGVLADPDRGHRDRAFGEGGFRLDEAPMNEMPQHFPYLIKGELQQERPELVGRAACVRTEDWTFVYRRYESDELYDRRDDPHETTNLVADPDHAEVLRSLRDDLLRWMVDTSDVIRPVRDPRFEPAVLDHLLGTATIEWPPEQDSVP